VEKVSEGRADRVAIGTTSRGIGPCYEDKIGRRGIRMADLVAGNFDALYRDLAEDKATLAKAFEIANDLDLDAILAEYKELASRLKPMVCDTVHLLSTAVRGGKRIMFEGAQGTMLDVDHGTYPFVTSSSATAGGACTGTGVPPTAINGVLGISKAYITRVGAGPFPTELHDEQGELIRQRGNEFGSVTGRPRRCGWFDIPLLKYTAAINGFDSLVITKLDVMDGLAEVKVCVDYKLRGEILEGMPAINADLDAVEPVYQTLPGWSEPTRGVTDVTKLPAAARDYLRFLEESTGVEVGCISTGPERNETIVVPGSKLSKLI
jgi:adenylosuccinate synthase